MRVWREASIQAFGYAACAATFQTPAPAPAPKARPAPALKAVDALPLSIAPARGSGRPVNREMPFLAPLEAPRLARADWQAARRRILADPALTRAGATVAMTLFKHQWYGKTHSWPSYRRMAEVAEVSERTIARGMANLVELGYIQRQRRGRLGNPRGGRRSNLYSLQLEICFGRKHPNPAKPSASKTSHKAARASTPPIDSERHHNRNTSNPPTPLSGESASQSKSTPGLAREGLEHHDRLPVVSMPSPLPDSPTSQAKAQAQAQAQAKAQAKAPATPVRHGGGTGRPCPRCGVPLIIQRAPEGTLAFCLTCGFDGGIKPHDSLQGSARDDNCGHNVATSRSSIVKSRTGRTPVRGARDRQHRGHGDPYADKRSGG